MIWQKRFGMELIAVMVMIAVVSVLAVYQYRWTGEISRTEQTRLRNSLATSVRNFDQEFSYDFQQLCESFELDPEAEPTAIESRVARQQAYWNRVSSHAQFVEGLHIWRMASGDASEFESLNENDNQFHIAPWPPELEPLRPLLANQFEQAFSVTNDRDAVYYPWTFYGDVPALLRPIFQIVPGGHGPGPGVHTIGVLVVALNREYLERQYLPELVDRHFGPVGQRSFVVSVRTVKAPYRTIYLSDANSPVVISVPDAAVNLFDLVGEEARRRGHPQLQAGDPGKQWQLVAQHPAGSLEEAVASWRRRNLAISLGLLAILAGSMALIFPGRAARRPLPRCRWSLSPACPMNCALRWPSSIPRRKTWRMESSKTPSRCRNTAA